QGAALEKENLTSVSDLELFVSETHVDLIAPAVGNVHGMLKSGSHPQIYIDHIRALASASSAGLVLHGGSGISDEQIRLAVQAGVCILHINTELRLAWKTGFELALLSHPSEIVPYKILPDVIDNLKKIVEKKV